MFISASPSLDTSVYKPFAGLQCGSDSLTRFTNSSLHIFVPPVLIIKSHALRLSISIQNKSFLISSTSNSLLPKQPFSSSLKKIALHGTLSRSSRQATIPHLSSPPIPCPLKLVNTSTLSNSGSGTSPWTVSKWQQKTGKGISSFTFFTVMLP